MTEEINLKLKKYALYSIILFFISGLSIFIAYYSIDNGAKLKSDELLVMQSSVENLNKTYLDIIKNKEQLIQNYNDCFGCTFCNNYHHSTLRLLRMWML